jgi:FeS assembly SUF system protein
MGDLLHNKSADTAATRALEARIILVLKTIYDPELPVNIYDLGLIYGLEVDAEGVVQIKMTLTSPGCPVAQSFPGTVAARVEAVKGVSEAQVELVWEPAWSRECMSEAVRLQLGLL